VPELPETETIARDLDRTLRNARIVDVDVARPDVLREVTPATLLQRVCGATIRRCWRRAKIVLLDLSTDDRIVVQPRFTGALLLDAGALPDRERRYSTLAFHLEDRRVLHYRDIRRLGTVALMSPLRWDDYATRLGAEPLDPAFTAPYLSALVRASRQPIKKLLMDQRLVAGVGNIYANEALWHAGIAPARAGQTLTDPEAARLRDAIVSTLTEAVDARGTSLRDYRDASGNPGRFADRLAVYGRGGAPCPRCHQPLDATHALDGRTTVWCPSCQT
jgi:formamidopyrimidine-DNA glycosylase